MWTLFLKRKRDISLNTYFMIWSEYKLYHIHSYIWFLSISVTGKSFRSFSKGVISSSSSLCCANMKSSSWSNCCCCCLTLSILPLSERIFSPLDIKRESQAFSCLAWLMKNLLCSSRSIVHLLMESSNWPKLKEPVAVIAAVEVTGWIPL